MQIDSEWKKEDDKISGTKGGQKDCNVHNIYATNTTRDMILLLFCNIYS